MSLHQAKIIKQSFRYAPCYFAYDTSGKFEIYIVLCLAFDSPHRVITAFTPSMRPVTINMLERRVLLLLLLFGLFCLIKVLESGAILYI